MSYVEWMGHTWRATEQTAELRLSLWPPDSGHPRPSWWLDLFHFPVPPDPDPNVLHPSLDLNVSELFYYGNDWRGFSGYEIRADAAWHDAHEHTTRHHREMEARITMLGPATPFPVAEGSERNHERWTAHQFLLRFGTRDGLAFPLELDAWMMRESEYYRTTPDLSGESARIPDTPPNLRIITQAVFVTGNVNVPRAGAADPVGYARRALRETVAYDGPLCLPEVNWALHFAPDQQKTVPMPGWSSTVGFNTETPP